MCRAEARTASCSQPTAGAETEIQRQRERPQESTLNDRRRCHTTKCSPDSAKKLQVTCSSLIASRQCRSGKCYHFPICKNALRHCAKFQNYKTNALVVNLPTFRPKHQPQNSTIQHSKVTLQSVWIISDVTGCNSVGRCRRGGQWAWGRHLSSAPLSM